jgi:hypothetical protein
MPSSSKKQHNFMNAIAHNKAFAKKVGVPQSVGQDFSNADKGKTFKKGGDTMASKMNPQMMAMMAAKKKPAMPVGGRMGADNQMMQAGRPMPGTPGMPMKKGGMTKMAKGGMAQSDLSQDKKMIKKAIKQHDEQEHKGGKGTTLKLAKGGTFRKSANGVAKKGLTKATMVKMKNGGRAC